MVGWLRSLIFWRCGRKYRPTELFSETGPLANDCRNKNRQSKYQQRQVGNPIQLASVPATQDRSARFRSDPFIKSHARTGGEKGYRESEFCNRFHFHSLRTVALDGKKTAPNWRGLCSDGGFHAAREMTKASSMIAHMNSILESKAKQLTFP